jgi:hypothetical protein
MASSQALGAAGALNGVVYHSNGSTVPDAPVWVRSTDGGTDLRTRSDANGQFEFPSLPAGTYAVAVNMPCCEFIPFSAEGVIVEAGANRFDIHMPPGNLFIEGDDPATVNAQLLARQQIPDEPPPRMPDGKPDLTGVWLTSEDPYPEDPKPLPWAAKVAEERAATWFVDDPMLQCLPGSPPAPGGSSFMTRFVQRPEMLVILLEDVVGFRQVFLDGRDHPEDPEPTWTGHSIGRWDGDTLVIDTIGYNDRGWTNVFPRTEAMRMTERYSRPEYGKLKLAVTYEDPGVFEEPWTLNMTWDLAPQEELMEYVCENNQWSDAAANKELNQ